MPPLTSSPFKFAAPARGFCLATCCLAALLLGSCKSSKKESGASSDDSGDPAVTTATAVPATEALPLTGLKRLAEPCALVRLPDGTLRQGIILQGGQDSSGRTEHLVLCDVPADVDAVHIACGKSESPHILAAKRQGVFPGGLAIFSIHTSPKLTSFQKSSGQAPRSFHAFRLAQGEALAAGKTEQIRAEIQQAQTALNDIRRESRERMMASRRNGGRPTSRTSTQETQLAADISALSSRLKFPVNSITLEETAAAATIDALESSKARLENTILASSDLRIVAIRHQGKWLNIDEVIASAPTRPDQVTINLNGSDSSVRLDCKLGWKLPPEAAQFSMVAATTHELESNGRGTLEERLGRVTPRPFPASGSSRELSADLSWGGLPTTLWVRVFENSQPDQPIIDESILLEHGDSFTAKWAKPPSPLIAIPEADPDSPEDFVAERSVIQASGAILDLVAAGDGSRLMLRSAGPPFWTALDLKTGTLAENPPWKATADTLLAVQAGKIYLIDRKSKMVEIRDEATGERDAVKLLPVDGEIVSVAAPRSAPGRPVLVSTTTGAWFVNPADFKILNCGFDLSGIFTTPPRQNHTVTQLDPPTIRVRASDDGSIYTLTGIRPGGRESKLMTLTLTMDSELVVQSSLGDPVLVPTRGRVLLRGFPDHGGRDISATGVRNSKSFPHPQGAIEFRTKAGREVLGAVNSAPVVPANPRAAGKAPLAFDRGLYLDSTLGVCLLPDGDRLHLLKVKLPETELLEPDFVFAGETLNFPLPAGSGHRATSDIGGEIVIAQNNLTWTAPVKTNAFTAHLNLEWTGELGSPMNRAFRLNKIATAAIPVAISSDGSRKMRLPRRTSIQTGDSPSGIAGAGHVLLTSDHQKKSAWSLTTGERLCDVDGSSNAFFGDTDQLYLLNQNGLLKSYDIRTGNELKSQEFGSASQGDRRRLGSVVTGFASRGPLVALIHEGSKNYIAQINRETLAPTLLDIPNDHTAPSFGFRLKSNASGSVISGFAASIYRQGDRVTVKPLPAIEGMPDAVGRYIVGDGALIDAGANPPQRIAAENLPGAKEDSSLELDLSGHYLFIGDYEEASDSTLFSVRRLDGSFGELFKLRCEGRQAGVGLQIISSTKTLVFPLQGATQMLGVFDFDIPALQAELAKP